MSAFSKLSAVLLALCALLFARGAFACENCGSAYYGSQAVYSCTNALYDCRTESSLYQPRCDGGCYRHSPCGDGCYRHRDCCQHAYARGFRDGFETARYEGDSWRPHDGYHGDYDHHDGDWRDGDHGAWHDGDGYDGDGHDHDWHDDRHEGDDHDGR